MDLQDRNPFDRFDQQQAPAPRPQPGAAMPDRIYGAPKTIDPAERVRLQYAGNADQRAAEDQAMQRRLQALEIEAKKQALAKANDGTGEQGKAAGFYRRALDANSQYGGLKVGPRSYVGQMAAEAAPGAMGAFVDDSSRKQANAYMSDFIAATLRYESGAAIPPSEFHAQAARYFPQPGDDQATIDAKTRLRDNALNALKDSAGPAAANVPQPEAPKQTGGITDWIDSRFKERPQSWDVGQDGTLTLKFGDGSTQTVNAIDAKLTGSADYIDAYRKKFGEDPPIDIVGGSGEQPQPPQSESNFGQDFMRGVGGVVQGAGDVLGIVGNPINAGLNATGIPQALGAGELSTDIGTTLRSSLGLPFPQNDQQRTLDAINRGGTGALMLAGGAGAAGNALSALGGGGGSGGGGAVANALMRAGAAPAIDTASGAVGNAAAEMTRQSGGGALSQAGAGLLAGGLTAGAGNALRNALAPREANSVMQAAARQKVEPLAADVGGPAVRRLTAGAVQGPLSSGSVVEKSKAAVGQLQEAVQRTANRTGTVLPEDEAGMAVRRAGELFSKQSSERGGRLYARAEDMSQGVRIKARASLQAVDDQIARLQESAPVNSPLIKELGKFREALAQNTGISPSGLKDIRSVALKAAYNEDLRSTPAKQALGAVAEAIKADVETGLSAAGRKEALQAFRKADDYWRTRVEQIDQVLEPIVGGTKSGEDVLRAFEGMTRGRNGGVERLSKMLRLLPEQEASDVQATIIDRMGKATAGTQNADGTAFSAKSFLTNWNKMTPKAKAALFPSGETRSNLNDIALLADNMAQSQSYANHSNTAGGVVSQMMLSGGAGAVGGIKGLIVASALQYLSGKALASRALTNWIAKAPTQPNPKYIDRLAAVAANDPGIANEVRQMQQRLTEAMGQLPQRAAASGPAANQNERERRK